MTDYPLSPKISYLDCVTEPDWEATLSASKIAAFREQMLGSGFDSTVFMRCLLLLTQQLSSKRQADGPRRRRTVSESPVVRDYVYDSQPFQIHPGGDR